jgi:phosphoribosyl 1,2-cyclic phosphodiesterase
MIVRCWGVRGSVPTPRQQTLRYGGNTPCVSIDLGGRTLIVLDAGTGIVELGRTIDPRIETIVLLLTHLHADHIQGFTFFAPIYHHDRRIYLPPSPVHPEWSLMNLFDGVHFPLTAQQIHGAPSLSYESAMEALAADGVSVDYIATNHPGGAVGYRIERGGRRVVFIPDNELEPTYRRTTGHEEFVDFCRDADLLIHDSQYLTPELPRMAGRGHSTFEQACSLASDARVRRLVLYHHDPERTDDQLDSIGDQARRLLAAHGAGVECIVAHEGLEIEIGADDVDLRNQ